MKRALLLAALALSGCDALTGGEPAARFDLDEIDSAKASATPTATASASTSTHPNVCEDLVFEEKHFTHCVADPAQHVISTALGAQGQAPYRSFVAYRAEKGGEDVAFAMNAGMFDDRGHPIGYYVQNGDRLHELNRADGPGNFHLKPNGVFFGTGGTWKVMASDAFYSGVKDRPAFGTQSGPMLVIDGEIHPEIAENGPSRLIRNGVGVDAAGKAHFVISDGAVSFGTFARLFRDRLETPNALYFDGTVSSLWNPAADRMDARAPLGPLIVVEWKEENR